MVICEGAGHEVTRARSANEALSHLATAPFDLVLLGIFLPRKDGLELMALIRGNGAWRALPLVVVTAQGDHIEHARYREAGARAVLPKPYEAGELTQVVHHVMTLAGRA